MLMYCKISSEYWLIIFGTIVAILLRCGTSLHSYSGEAAPPLYGDYEAQRHWMEITVNLPMKDWYRNTVDNVLDYWGLDYPPLTAYHMYLCGKIGTFINPNYTKLHDSRGYESENHKLFMRYTVFVGDLLIFIPSVILYYCTCIKLTATTKPEVKVKSKKSAARLMLPNTKIMDSSLSIILALFYPGIILIDHGHFQYNCMSLGLLIFATICIIQRKSILATIFFCLALNYKQMELYHSLPFFLYLLSTCVPKPGQSSLHGIFRLAIISLTVIVVFGLIWLPFLFDLDDLLQVLHRQFPVARGVFEDKVSNLWCTLNILYKLRKHFDNYQMMRICLFSTISALLPSSVDLFLRPNVKKFILALINSSLAFFLFSFQVHEKSILLVAIPVLLYFPYEPFACFWFLYISVFSMVPLFIKDNLIIALIALTAFYVMTFRVSIEHSLKSSLNTKKGLIEYYYQLLGQLFYQTRPKNFRAAEKLLVAYLKDSQSKIALYTLICHFTIFMSICISWIIFILTLFVSPPNQYPHFYNVVISVYSFIHFLGFFIYFNIKQIRIPQEFEDVKHVKVKTS